MANEISIVVRVQNAASRGFDRIGQAAVGMNAAIEAAGSALESIDAIQSGGAERAARRAQTQNDVKQAMLDSEQAVNDLKQAEIDANQAKLDATAAQSDYNSAVKKFGANSEEAKQAQADLTQAQYDSTQATTDMKQAQIDSTQAQIDLNAAQRELNPTFAQQASQRFQELAPAIGLATIAASSLSGSMAITRARTIATAIATRTYAVAQRVLNAVMRANPIGLVITAITLLVAGLVLAYRRSDTFRAICQAAFRGVQAAGRALWSALRPALAALGSFLVSTGGKARTFYNVSRAAFSALVAFVRGMVGSFRSAFSGVASALSSAAGRVRAFVATARSVLSGLMSYVAGIPGRFSSAFGGLYGIITNPVRNAVNAVRSWLGGLLSYASSIPSRIGNTIKGAIPGFAHGGVVGQAASGGGRSGLTMTGEHGPELLQLPPGTRVRSNPDTRRMMATGSGGGGGGETVHRIIVEGTGMLKGLRKEIRIKGGTVQEVLG